MTVKELDTSYVANTYKRFPVEIVRGKGSYVYDENGKEYIDMGSGIAVNTFGLSDETWVNAVEAQLSKFQHTSNLYFSEPCAVLAKKLCEKTGMKKVFFSNSGAEANECAIKAARKYACEMKGEEYFTIVTLKNSFHGRTLTTLSATGQDRFHELFKPLTPGFVHATANDEKELEEILKTQKIAAVMIECVQGEGGVMALSESYVKNLFALAKKYDVLTVVDEVQTGNGRSGMLYSYMNFGVSPDIVSTAKGLGGGLPLGATMLSEKLENVFGPGDHGSTFGGNPVCCAGAISVLDRLDDGFLKTVREKSKFLFDAFSGAKGIKSVSGMGLMIGLETEKAASDVVNECIENGVLCLTAKNKVRLLPALNIPYDALNKAVDVIKRACAD
ncbi:MAG: acetylornithine/succinylornithine family transaminase [Clostridiales bacterium]|nr:acetylornithine/succinylornithine family transaminase [Clostridiales bacterium]